MVPARLFRKGKSLWFWDYVPFRQTCAFSLPKKPSSNFIFPRLHLRHPLSNTVVAKNSAAERAGPSGPRAGPPKRA